MRTNWNECAIALVVVALAVALPGTLHARDPGINQPGALGNPRMDPGINQPGAVGNVGVGAPGVGAPGVGVRDPGINQPGAVGNVGVGAPGVGCARGRRGGSRHQSARRGRKRRHRPAFGAQVIALLAVDR